MQEYLKHASANDVMNKDNFVEACLNCRWKFDRELHLQEMFRSDESNEQKKIAKKSSANLFYAFQNFYQSIKIPKVFLLLACA